MTLNDLSFEAKQICKENYQSNCGNCPLRSACVTSPRLNKKSHNDWIRNLNEEAYLVWIKECVNGEEVIYEAL